MKKRLGPRNHFLATVGVALGSWLTTFNEVDMSAILAFRQQYQESFQKKYGIKLGFMSFFVKAVINGLKQFPLLNAEIRDADVVYPASGFATLPLRVR